MRALRLLSLAVLAQAVQDRALAFLQSEDAAAWCAAAGLHHRWVLQQQPPRGWTRISEEDEV